MDHFAGLDESVKETSVCTVDDTGRIIREVKVASEPEALLGSGCGTPPGTSSGSDWKPGRCWCTRRVALPWLPPRRGAMQG